MKLLDLQMMGDLSRYLEVIMTTSHRGLPAELENFRQ